MRQLILLSLLCSGVLCFAGCSGGDNGHGHDHGPGGHSHEAGDGHDHGSGDTDMHGERQQIGSITAGSAKATVFQFGKLELGKEAHVEVELADQGAATAVRVWYGDESGRGAMKALADKQDSGIYHAHVEVKKDAPASAQFWIEVETKDGDRGRAAVAPAR
ncbi:MAG: hypothetical protein AAF581_12355 [Planctomycetota bacterium]